MISVVALFACHRQGVSAPTHAIDVDLAPARDPLSSWQQGWSGRRDSNPRRPPWQGGTLPLSYSRGSDPRSNITTRSNLRSFASVRARRRSLSSSALFQPLDFGFGGLQVSFLLPKLGAHASKL
jgi:hypothetical protein